MAVGETRQATRDRHENQRLAEHVLIPVLMAFVAIVVPTVSNARHSKACVSGVSTSSSDSG